MLRKSHYGLYKHQELPIVLSKNLRKLTCYEIIGASSSTQSILFQVFSADDAQSLIPSFRCPFQYFLGSHACNLWDAIKRFRFLYKSQTRPSLKCCSYVWGGAPKSTLCLLDKIQSKAIRLINNPNLTKSLQPLSNRRLVGYLSTFYIYFQGHYSQEIREIIPVPLRRVRTTRSSTQSHPFQFSVPDSQFLSSKSPFIPRTCNLWNVLPNLPSFKSKINELDLISLSSYPFASFFLPLFVLCIGHQMAFLQNYNSLDPPKIVLGE